MDVLCNCSILYLVKHIRYIYTSVYISLFLLNQASRYLDWFPNTQQSIANKLCFFSRSTECCPFICLNGSAKRHVLPGPLGAWAPNAEDVQLLQLVHGGPRRGRTRKTVTTCESKFLKIRVLEAKVCYMSQNLENWIYILVAKTYVSWYLIKSMC